MRLLRCVVNHRVRVFLREGMRIRVCKVAILGPSTRLRSRRSRLHRL
jgi:hypothetical protein